MRANRIVVIFGLTILFTGAGGCARFVDYGEGYSKDKPYSEPRPPKNTSITYHTVTKGETLYSIAWQYGHDYRTVAKWNDLPRSYTIYPGQKLRVRPPGGTTASKSNSKSPSTKTSRSPSKTRSAVTTSSRSPHWRWPTEGKVISHFAAGDPARQGIDISGKRGQAIIAAASGKVVYSGNGLRGYGNLVIIQHNETYFSAYAHNQKVLVKENEKVKSGQRIADMGNSGTDRVMLHFEIRRNGRPSNPLQYLPKKGS
jgi:lipoprotein NlpD